MGCHSLLQGIFPTPGIEPKSLMSPALTGGFFTTESLGKPSLSIDSTALLRIYFEQVELSDFPYTENESFNMQQSKYPAGDSVPVVKSAVREEQKY